MFALFGAVGIAVFVLIHLYLWKRLVHDPLRLGLGHRIGSIVVVLLGVLAPATLIGVRSGAVEWLAWPGYLWIALMFYLLVVLAVLELPRLAIRLWWRFRSPAVAAPVASSVAASGASPVAASGATPTDEPALVGAGTS